MATDRSEVAERLGGLSESRRALLERMLADRRRGGDPAAGAARVAEPAGPIPAGSEAPGEPAPLSHIQRQIWTAEQFGPGMATYNVPFCFRITGPLDVAAMERALHHLIARHPALRTRYEQRDGVPVQVVSDDAVDAVDSAVRRVDVGHLNPGDREAEARRLATAVARTPFDLERDIKLRASVIRLADDDHVLALALHHLSCDGMSAGIVFDELGVAYAAYAAGRTPDLPAVPIQYADYARWVLRERTPEALRPQLEYWTRRLRGELPALGLPEDRRRPQPQSFRGGAYWFSLPGELLDRIGAVGRAQGATLVSTLIAAYQVLLTRFAGQDEVLIGLAVADRDRLELEPLVGCLINNVVIRGELADDPTFGELVRRVHETSVQAYANRQVPFPMLVDELKVPRDPGRNPVFQTMLVLTDPPARPRIDGCAVAPIEVDNGTAKMDLTLVLERDGGLVTGFFEYAADLFDEATIAQLARSWLSLLEGIAADPAGPISRLPLLDDAERAGLLSGGSPRHVFPVRPLVPERIAEQARIRPAAPAVRYGDTTVTYRELDARANRLARRLRGLGVGRGTPVAVRVERSARLPVGLLAIWRAGGAYVPVEPSVPDERLRFILADAEVPVLLTDGARAGLPVPPDVIVVPLDADADADADRDADADEQIVGNEPDDLAYVIYTSGSTGRPKGVQVTHANVARLFRATEDWFGFDEHDRWSVFHSYAFDFSVWELWGALVHGGCAVIVPQEVTRSPRDCYELLARERVTVLNQTPTSFRMLMDVERSAGPNGDPLPGLDDLRLVIFGGEALDLDRLTPWWDRHGDERPRLVNMYGITETTVHVTYRPITRADTEAGRGSVIGEPLPDLALRLLDGNGEPVPAGCPGELYVSGAGVSRGYLNRPDVQAERFVPDPHGTGTAYRTGDLARRRPDGDLVYLGRIDQQVQLRGHRIELGEIEATLRDLPGVGDACVVVREDRQDDERLVAYIVRADQAPAADASQDTDASPDTDAGPDPVALRRALTDRLPEYMVPAAYVAVDRLPMTPNGKLDVRALPAPAERSATGVAARSAGAGAGAGDRAAAAGREERIIAEAWAEEIGLDEVGLDDGFFDVGGNSLLLTRVDARVRRLLDPPPSMVDLLRYPTIRSLAAHLRREEERAGSAGLERAARRRLAGRSRRQVRRTGPGQGRESGTEQSDE